MTLAGRSAGGPRPTSRPSATTALGLLAQAQAELTRARTAGPPWRVELAEQTARLARTAVDVAARQVALRRGTCETLERELASDTEE